MYRLALRLNSRAPFGSLFLLSLLRSSQLVLAELLLGFSNSVCDRSLRCFGGSNHGTDRYASGWWCADPVDEGIVAEGYLVTAERADVRFGKGRMATVSDVDALVVATRRMWLGVFS